MKNQSMDDHMPTSISQVKKLCCGCGEDKSLIEAHIVPKAFCKRLSKPNEAAKLVSLGEYAKRSPTGYYDPNILCNKCDGQLGAYDDYAFSFLHGSIGGKRTVFEPIVELGQLVGMRVQEFDFKLLRLFILSVLWRASISEKDFCSGTKLGKDERNHLRDIVLYDAPIGDDEYPFYCGKIILNGKGGLIHTPYLQIEDGVRFYNFCTGEFFFLVKVDAAPTLALYSEWTAKPDRPLICLTFPIGASPQLRSAIDVAKSSKVKYKKTT